MKRNNFTGQVFTLQLLLATDATTNFAYSPLVICNLTQMSFFMLLSFKK